MLDASIHRFLRLTDLRHDAAQSGSDARVHHEPTQETSKLVEIAAMQLMHLSYQHQCRVRSEVPCRTRIDEY